jgi:hypothetical protein
MVHQCSRSTGKKPQEIRNDLYKKFCEETGMDITNRPARAMRLSTIDFIADQGLLDKLESVANDFFR